MKTEPLKQSARCMYERYDEKNKSYVCDRPAVCNWCATSEVSLPVCTSCRAWIETLEELGQKP